MAFKTTKKALSAWRESWDALTGGHRGLSKSDLPPYMQHYPVECCSRIGKWYHVVINDNLMICDFFGTLEDMQHEFDKGDEEHGTNETDAAGNHDQTDAER